MHIFLIVFIFLLKILKFLTPNEFFFTNFANQKVAFIT